MISYLFLTKFMNTYIKGANSRDIQHQNMKLVDSKQKYHLRSVSNTKLTRFSFVPRVRYRPWIMLYNTDLVEDAASHDDMLVCR